MPKHRHGHPHVLPLHAQHGAHVASERSGAGRHGRFIPLIAVGLAVAVVIGIAAAVGTWGGHDSGSTGPAGAGAASGPSSSEDPDLRRCRASWRAMHDDLVTAEPPMGQWERHIRVMNRLVAGEITLAEASRFWNQTRVAAWQHYDAFATRDRGLRRSGAANGCGRRHDRASPSTALGACARAAAAEAATLDAARTTLDRWSHHIRAMDQLRAGTLDPAMAVQMWQSSWRQGVAEVRIYHERERRSSSLACQA